MNIIEKIEAAASRRQASVVFPEGNDARTLQAVAMLMERRIVRPVVIGNRAALSQVASEAGIELSPTLRVIEPATFEQLDEFAQEFYALRKHPDYQDQAVQIYRDTIARHTAAGHEQLPTMAHYLSRIVQTAGVREGQDRDLKDGGGRGTSQDRNGRPNQAANKGAGQSEGIHGGAVYGGSTGQAV